MSAKQMPIWKRHPCAPWCIVTHADGDTIEDRVCFSGYRNIGRTLAEALQVNGAWMLDELRVGLESGFRELMPHLTVSYGSGILADPASGAYNMTLDEAEDLAGLIVGLIADARLSGNTTGGKRWAAWQRTACPAWCTSEHSDADGRAARSCVGAERHVDLSLEEPLHVDDEWFTNSVLVSIERDAREIEAKVLLYLGTGSGLELTLAEAEEYAATLLKLAGMALGTGAVHVEAKDAVCARFGVRHG